MLKLSSPSRPAPLNGVQVENNKRKCWKLSFPTPKRQIHSLYQLYTLVYSQNIHYMGTENVNTQVKSTVDNVSKNASLERSKWVGYAMYTAVYTNCIHIFLRQTSPMFKCRFKGKMAQDPHRHRIGKRLGPSDLWIRADQPKLNFLSPLPLFIYSCLTNILVSI